MRGAVRLAAGIGLALSLACSGMTPAGAFYAAVDATLPALAAADAWLYTAEARNHPAEYEQVKSAVRVAWLVVDQTDQAIRAGGITEEQVQAAADFVAAKLEEAAQARSRAAAGGH